MDYQVINFLAETVYYALVPLLALVGGGIALWRSMIANRNLRQERFKVGAELLSYGQNYIGRTAGAAILAKLISEHPKEFDFPVTRTFEGILEHPARYQGSPGNPHVPSKVDYFSPDTVIIVKALNARKIKYRKKHPLRLSAGGPFISNRDSIVEPNYTHPDCPGNLDALLKVYEC